MRPAEEIKKIEKQSRSAQKVLKHLVNALNGVPMLSDEITRLHQEIDHLKEANNEVMRRLNRMSNNRRWLARMTDITEQEQEPTDADISTVAMLMNSKDETLGFLRRTGFITRLADELTKENRRLKFEIEKYTKIIARNCHTCGKLGQCGLDLCGEGLPGYELNQNLLYCLTPDEAAEEERKEKEKLESSGTA